MVEPAQCKCFHIAAVAVAGTCVAVLDDAAFVVTVVRYKRVHTRTESSSRVWFLFYRVCCGAKTGPQGSHDQGR